MNEEQQRNYDWVINSAREGIEWHLGQGDRISHVLLGIESWGVLMSVANAFSVIRPALDSANACLLLGYPVKVQDSVDPWTVRIVLAACSDHVDPQIHTCDVTCWMT